VTVEEQPLWLLFFFTKQTATGDIQ